MLTGRALWQKLWLHDTKQCTQMQMEQEVFILADISSSDGCAMQLISQEEGSESQSMSFVCSSMTGVE